MKKEVSEVLKKSKTMKVVSICIWKNVAGVLMKFQLICL